MSREPIKEDVKRRLYAESMGRCMNPGCRAKLFKSRGDIIEKAHIVPYCETVDNSFENLVLLCPNCHTDFDKNGAFTSDEVLGWKKIREQEVDAFFSKRYKSFDELSFDVKPLLLENKYIYEQYYLGNKKGLWDIFEPKILINNRQLKLMFSHNLHLFQTNQDEKKSNQEYIISFIRHVDEFEATRSDSEKVRKALFPLEINSIFGIAPVHESLLPMTESLEEYINALLKQGKSVQIVLGVEEPFIDIIQDSEINRLYLDDVPRLRQLYYEHHCFRKAQVRLESLNFALMYIRKRGLKFLFSYPGNVRNILVNGINIVFVYEYCLSKVDIMQMCPNEGTVIVNLHNWNGKSCISSEAYDAALEFGAQLLRMEEFYGFIRKISS